jgi:hypothetical protein
MLLRLSSFTSIFKRRVGIVVRDELVVFSAHHALLEQNDYFNIFGNLLP